MERFTELGRQLADALNCRDEHAALGLHYHFKYLRAELPSGDRARAAQAHFAGYRERRWHDGKCFH